MDDSKAIRRLKDGDPGGLELLMERYQVKAARAAYLITHDLALAEDVVQETFIRLFQRIRQFDATRPLEPYLMRSVVNAALNAIRGNSRFDRLEDDDSEVKNLLDRGVSVESQVEFSQLQHEIITALSKLSPRQRAVIVQRYYLDLSEQEMAQSLDIAPGTIKWLLSTARKRLRRLLGVERRPNE